MDGKGEGSVLNRIESLPVSHLHVPETILALHNVKDYSQPYTVDTYPHFQLRKLRHRGFKSKVAQLVSGRARTPKQLVPCDLVFLAIMFTVQRESSHRMVNLQC